MWFCIFSSYVYTGSKIYLQINGFGMVTCYSYTSTILLLFYCEFRYSIKTAYLRFLAYIYIYDLLGLNFDGGFLQAISVRFSSLTGQQ